MSVCACPPSHPCPPSPPRPQKPPHLPQRPPNNKAPPKERTANDAPKRHQSSSLFPPRPAPTPLPTQSGTKAAPRQPQSGTSKQQHHTTPPLTLRVFLIDLLMVSMSKGFREMRSMTFEGGGGGFGWLVWLVGLLGWEVGWVGDGCNKTPETARKKRQNSAPKTARNRPPNQPQ